MYLFSRYDNPVARKMIASIMEEVGLPPCFTMRLALVPRREEVDQNRHLCREMTAVRVERVNGKRLCLERGQKRTDFTGGDGRAGYDARHIGETQSGFGRARQASALE